MKRLFLHVPKCAGTSVKKILDDHFSAETIYDYGDNYFRFPRRERNPVLLKALFEPKPVGEDKTVFGHFFPIKYLGAEREADVKLVTILRDPIDRLISHYNFTKQGDFPEHYIWRKLTDENWSFEDFAFSEQMKDYYAQFLIGIGLSNFDYIGISENMNESVLGCFAALGVELPPDVRIPKENVTPRPDAPRISEDLARALRDRHADDYLIYEFARKKFHGSAKGDA